jgi:NitT/TauT family transport system permease protein
LLAPIAPIAWIPTAIILFGLTNVTAIFIVFMGVFFILTLATLAEIQRIPKEFLTVAGNLGANRGQQWVWVVIPAILPGVFTLLRTNFIAAWMAVLVAEMVGLRDGLGAIIMMGRNLFNNELIMFGMLVIGISGYAVDRILVLIGRRLLWWRV